MAKNTKRRNKNRVSQRRVSRRRVSRRRVSRGRVSRHRVSKKNNKRSRKIYKRKMMRGGSDLIMQQFMQSTGLNEEQAALKLAEADGDIGLATERLEKKISREGAKQIFMALTHLPETRAILYLEDPSVNFDIRKAEGLFIEDPNIGTGAVAPAAPVAPPVAPVAALAPAGTVTNLKDAFQGGYNVFIAFFRVKGGECENSPFGGARSEHITFYNFRVNGKHPCEKRIFKEPRNTHTKIYKEIIKAWNKMTSDTGTTDTCIILDKVGTTKLGIHDAIQYKARKDKYWSYFKKNLLYNIGKLLSIQNGRMNTYTDKGFKYFGGLDMNAGNYKNNSLIAVVDNHFGKDSWIPHMSTVESLDAKPFERYPLVINLNPVVDGNGDGWCLRCGIGTDPNVILL